MSLQISRSVIDTSTSPTVENCSLTRDTRSNVRKLFLLPTLSLIVFACRKVGKYCVEKLRKSEVLVCE